MAVNKYFNLHGAGQTNESDLIQQMTDECIQVTGVDVYYLPRTVVAEDTLFGEDILSSFDTKYQIEMYIDSFDGYQGEDILAQFGISVTDQIEFTVSVPRFTEETGMDKPLEGDLVYWPTANALFEIKFAEDELQNFYAHGKLYTWKIKCQLFDFSHETITTLADIDPDLVAADEINITREENAVNLITNPDTEPTLVDGVSSNSDIETEADTVIDFSEQNPFGSY